MILQIAPLIDQISVLGGVVIPIVDVGCHGKGRSIPKADRGIGKRVCQEEKKCARCQENSYNLASVRSGNWSIGYRRLGGRVIMHTVVKGPSTLATRC